MKKNNILILIVFMLSMFSFCYGSTNYEVEKMYDEQNNKVTVSVISEVKLKQIKPTWKIDKTGKIYTKVYDKNGEYKTTFTNENGYQESVSFTIDEIDEVGPEITIEKVYDEENNKVEVKAISKEKLGKTKVTWNLDETALIYTKVYEKNGTYTTDYKDIYGNKTLVTFSIDEIKSGYEVEKTYDEQNNKVTVSVISKAKLKQIKPTWKIDKTGKIYTKVYDKNGTYTTVFTDENGYKESISFMIDEIDEVGPEITIEKVYDEESNKVEVKAISKEKLGKTKVTWNLDETALIYTKVYEKNGTYTTDYKDIYGNKTLVTFSIDEIKSGYEIEKSYNELNNKVTVSIISKAKLKQIKPTWKIDETGKIYTKLYDKNGTYTTVFTDENGYQERVSFTIDEINNKNYKTNDIRISSYLLNEYNKKIDEAKSLSNDNTFTFAFTTDIHLNNEYATMNSINAFIMASNEDFVDVAIIGGDLYSAYKTNKEEGLYYSNYIKDKLSQNVTKNVLFTNGNHECNAKLSSKNYISNEEYSDIFSKNIEGQVYNSNDTNHSYYYVDYEKYKVRVCILDAYTGNGEEKILGQKQLEFIANQVLNFDSKESSDDWKVMFVAHQVDLSEDKKTFDNILKAYKNGGSTTIFKKEISYSKKGVIIGVFTGHYHEDNLINNGIYTDFQTQRGFSKKNEIGSKNELGFSIVTVNLDENKVYETKFGRGTNRTFTYN